MTRKRRLRPEELELWHQVARQADPLHPRQNRPKPAAAKTKPREPVGPSTPPATETRPLHPFEIGAKATRTDARHDVLPSVGERLAKAPVRMDRKKHTRMTRGKLEPEGRIDLHGMTLAEAHPALIGFILQSSAMGRRLVLVITGKGREGGDGDPLRPRGVLKQQVPQWLRMAPAGSCVLQISEAHIRHGGSGAYYVYLRRSR